MQPSNATITIDGQSFDAMSSHVELSTHHDDRGMPQMGTLRVSINAIVDMHDDENLPFSTLSTLYQLANVVTRDKIKDIKIEFWKDEAQQDALCTYSFRGWISLFSTTSGAGSNHTMRLVLQPELGKQNFLEMKMGN